MIPYKFHFLGAEKDEANRQKLVIKTGKGGSYCCVKWCKSRRGRDKVGFFKVKSKKYPSKTLAWARAIPWKKSNFWPTEHTLICGEHFISGKPALESNR